MSDQPAPRFRTLSEALDDLFSNDDFLPPPAQPAAIEMRLEFGDVIVIYGQGNKRLQRLEAANVAENSGDDTIGIASHTDSIHTEKQKAFFVIPSLLANKLLGAGYSQAEVDRIIEIAIETTKPYIVPEQPKRLWKDRVGDITPPEFIMQEYGDGLGKGLETGHIARLDPSLYKAYGRHVEKGKSLPAGFDLPTKSEAIEREPELSEDAARFAHKVFQRRYRPGRDRDR